MIDRTYFGLNEMQYLREVCDHADRHWVESNFASIVKYSVYACSNEQRAVLLEPYDSFDVRKAVVVKLRKEILDRK